MIKPIISRVGGKWYCCKKVLAHFPTDYDIYIEPFVGGGSIYFNSPKKGMEVINDLDSNVIDIYQVCKEKAFEIEAKTYTQEDYTRLKEEPALDVRTKLTNKLITRRLSFFGIGKFNSENATISASFCNKYKKYHERLQDTLICNKDYKEIIATFDSPSSFFYLDPPYENSSKTVRGNIYCDIDLDELKQILTCIKGKFLLSLNDSERVRNLFNEFTIDIVPTSYFGRTKDRKVNDLIIKNF
jgi:DNA adenine methylase